MENLFVIYIGGSCKGSLIELHDMRLIISDTIENTYEKPLGRVGGERQKVCI
jgi:hypothetical protein